MDPADIVLEAIHSRRSMRRFKDDPVPSEVIEKIVDAAACAPLGGNRRVSRFIAITNRETIGAMRDAVVKAVAEVRERISSSRAQQQYDGYTAHFAHFGEAPCVIAVVAKPYDSIYSRVVDKYVPAASRPAQHMVDVGIMSVAAAVENLLIAASALGYGACYMTGPLVAQCRFDELLAVEAPWHVVTLVPVGLPGADPGQRERLPLEGILTYVP
jgi:nitroreductase